MTPTICPGDWFLVDRKAPIERGAVVVHDAPPSSVSKDPLVKRVVAIGGDVVEVRDARLMLNGKPADRELARGPCTYETKSGDGHWREVPCVDFIERLGGHAYHTYCTPYMPCGPDLPSLVVPPRHVFVLGDHRDHSADSRIYGPIPEDSIFGRVLYVYFSIGPSGIQWDRVGKDVQ